MAPIPSIYRAHAGQCNESLPLILYCAVILLLVNAVVVLSEDRFLAQSTSFPSLFFVPSKFSVLDALDSPGATKDDADGGSWVYGESRLGVRGEGHRESKGQDYESDT